MQSALTLTELSRFKIPAMACQRFEDVPVLRKLSRVRLGQRSYTFTQNRPFKGQYSLRDQIERAYHLGLGLLVQAGAL